MFPMRFHRKLVVAIETCRRHVPTSWRYLFSLRLRAKKIPCVVGATQGEIFDRWLGGFITAPNFYILFLVTCQDNVNQSGNVGYIHYAVGVDVASSVSVSCSTENLVDKSSNVRNVNHAVGVDIALSAWLL